ncbi:MAG: polyketide synthase, partial [Candidatus Thermoplasmatota archaeon]|nr:polyketide synthase [Candidatus Thermoplasmatota archaeon]
MACYAAGGCDSPAALWDLLRSGRDTVTKIPSVSRFDVDALDGTPAELYTKRGHFVDGVELFDNAHFGVGAAEAKTMDPHQRLVLETGYQALAQSGHDKASLMGSDVGVFVGIARSDWENVQKDLSSRATSFSNLGMDPGAGAGRVSYLLGLKGPCFAVNTACSSSLVALDAACLNVTLGSCGFAVAAGTNLQLHAGNWAGFCAMRALSADGQCKTFDESADGYGRGEACGAMVIRSSKRDGDLKETAREQALAWLTGTAVNQDGKSASFMAPNGPSQEALLREAMAEAGPRWADQAGEHGAGLGYV